MSEENEEKQTEKEISAGELKAGMSVKHKGKFMKVKSAGMGASSRAGQETNLTLYGISGIIRIKSNRTVTVKV